MPTKPDIRQLISRDTLTRTTGSAGSQLDTVIRALESEITPPFALSVPGTNRVVTIGSITVSNPSTSLNRSTPPISNLLPNFSSATLTMSATGAGTATPSVGSAVSLGMTASQYMRIGINIDATGSVTLTKGTAASSLAAAGTPAVPSGLFAVGHVVVRTDASNNVANILTSDLYQYVGGGGGSGTGSGNPVLESLKNQHVDSPYELFTPNIISTDAATKFTSITGAAYDLVTNTIKFTANSQVATSVQMLDTNEFLGRGLDISSVDLSLFWNPGTTLQAFSIPTGFTYEVSRDGGTNWFPITMTQIGSTNTFRGALRFDTSTTTESTKQTIATQAVNDANVALNATTQQSTAQAFTLSAATKLQEVVLNLTKTGSPSGNMYVSIIKDSAGSPSTAAADIMCQTNAIAMSGLSTGSYTADITDVTLPAGTYHIVVSTDATYKSSFSAGVTQLALRARQTGPSAPFMTSNNGSSWSTLSPNSNLQYQINGRALDLRVRITSAGSPTYPCGLDGYGIFYNLQDVGVVGALPKKTQKFVFNSAADNLTSFTITNFTPDPDLLSCYWVEGGQVFKVPAFQLSGNIATFPTNTFYMSGQSQTITLIFDQNSGGAVDNSDSNAANILKLQDWSAAGAGIDQVVLSKISVPSTTIINRAQMVDLSQDLGVRMGVERIPIQQIMTIDGESGPNGELVYKPINDKYDQIRFVGAWRNKNSNNANGQYNQASSTSDYIEISFYGTGLNALMYTGNTTYSAVVSIDGGAETAWYPANPSVNNLLGSRNYSTNVVMNVVNGLSLGLHTAKIRNTDATNGIAIYGLEILNESSSLKVAPGTSIVKGNKLTSSSLYSTAYNSGFTNIYGTAGTKGGRVLVYQKSDGTIAKDIQYVDTSSQTLTSASHANEEVIRSYFFREFGSARTDDFSTLTSISNRVFTLDDGTTTLSGSSVTASFNQFQTEGESLRMNTSEAITLTFVGTGLDAFFVANATPRDVDVSIDGAANINLTVGANFMGVKKVVSGLPYGTHVVKFTQTSANNPGFQNFIVYGPKKPALPAGAIELADYNIVGNFSAFSSSTNTSIAANSISQGVIRKANMREMVYSGSAWTATLDFQSASAWRVQTTTTAEYVEYTFVGTGFDMRYFLASNNATSATISIDGVTNLSGAGYTTGVYGGTSFTASTGVLNQSSAAGTGSGGAWVTGLTYGLHKVRVTYTSGGAALRVDSFDIISPIHTHKANGPYVVQNTLSVGSQGISDNRPLLTTMRDLGTTNVRSDAFIANSSTSSTTLVPIGDMGTSVYVAQDSMLDVSYAGTAYGNGANYVRLQVFIDGVGASQILAGAGTSGDYFNCCQLLIPITKGWHFVNIHHGANTGTVGTELGSGLYGRSVKVRLLPLKQ